MNYAKIERVDELVENDAYFNDALEEVAEEHNLNLALPEEELIDLIEQLDLMDQVAEKQRDMIYAAWEDQQISNNLMYEIN